MGPKKGAAVTPVVERNTPVISRTILASMMRGHQANGLEQFHAATRVTTEAISR